MATLTEIRNIVSDIRKGNLKPVYLLIGRDTYFADVIVKALEKHAIAAEDRDFNYNLYYGNETGADVVVNCAQQFPVMAPRKLVILKEAQSMHQAKTELDKFVPYVGRPNYTTTLIITYSGEKTAPATNLQKAVAKSDGVVVKCDPPRDYELPTYIKDYCNGLKIGIEDKAIQLLCDYIGSPLSKLFGELKKLVQINGGTGRITTEDVEKHIGVSRDFNNFELTSALVKRDYPKCMQIIDYFRNNPKPNPTVVTAATIFNLFSRLTIAHFLPDKNDSALMEVCAAKNKYALQELKTGLRNYSAAKAVNAIHLIREFDAKNKGIGSNANEYDLLQELIFKLMT